MTEQVGDTLIAKDDINFRFQIISLNEGRIKVRNYSNGIILSANYDVERLKRHWIFVSKDNYLLRLLL